MRTPRCQIWVGHKLVVEHGLVGHGLVMGWSWVVFDSHGLVVGWSCVGHGLVFVGHALVMSWSWVGHALVMGCSCVGLSGSDMSWAREGMARGGRGEAEVKGGVGRGRGRGRGRHERRRLSGAEDVGWRGLQQT